jgi:hypothetical protein
MTLEEIYQQKCSQENDIFQHLPTIRRIAEQCDSIIELGVRSIVSTWALLAGKPQSIISVDIHHPLYYYEYDPTGCNLDLVSKVAKENGIFFSFLQQDSRIRIGSCDLILFDTLHTREHLAAEIWVHRAGVRKYMIFHDTETFKDELMPVIEEFVLKNEAWYIYEKFFNNNGLTILKHS